MSKLKVKMQAKASKLAAKDAIKKKKKVSTEGHTAVFKKEEKTIFGSLLTLRGEPKTTKVSYVLQSRPRYVLLRRLIGNSPDNAGMRFMSSSIIVESDNKNALQDVAKLAMKNHKKEGYIVEDLQDETPSK